MDSVGGVSYPPTSSSPRPGPGQRRQVETGNPTCVSPGCRIPAAGCDLDHRIPWSQGGPTSNDNLTPLCRHDHRIRHQTDGHTNPSPAATTNGPAPSATPTPPAANHHKPGRWIACGPCPSSPPAP
ncbi:MAG: HNH endonuclease signature motif containing protein [Acidimicrobiia bacterium]